MTATCPCCDKPINKVQDIEPFAGLPDVIFALPPGERERRCKIHSDICTLDWNDKLRRRSFLRCVIPFSVHERPERTFNWGVWVELSKVRLLAILDVWNLDSQRDMPLMKATLANRVASGPLGADMWLKLTGPKTRPSLIFFDDSDHPLAEAQRAGVSISQTFEWTKPFHGLVAS